MHWRQTLRALHRDIGYAACALTLSYALSGLAVNHIEDWNSNYVIDETPLDLAMLGDIAPLASGDLDVMEAHIVTALSIPPETVQGRVLASESLFRVYLKGGDEIRIDIHTGHGSFKRTRTRIALYELNALHLNNLKGIWTWIADGFAIALAFLAMSGLFLNKGKNGLLGRGKWFFVAGLMVPIAFVIYLHA